MAPTPRFRVPAPATSPTPFGLLSVAQVIDGDTIAPEWRHGLEWESSCGAGPRVTVDACLADDNAGDTVEAGGTKSLTRGVSHLTGPAFTLYAGHRCSAGGRTREQDRERAGRLLTNGEAAALEQVIATGGAALGAPTGADVRAESLAATAQAIDSPLPANAAGALALAEGIGGGNFAGVGYVIHAPRALVSLWSHSGAIVRNGGRLETVLGTPIAAGAGYPGGAPDGTDLDAALFSWVYVTGPVVVYRGPVETMPDVSTLDRSTNDVFVLAERTYAVGWDCGAVAIPVPLSELFTPEEG